jgi:hypothetical protein
VHEPSGRLTWHAADGAMDAWVPRLMLSSRTGMFMVTNQEAIGELAGCGFLVADTATMSEQFAALWGTVSLIQVRG